MCIVYHKPKSVWGLTSNGEKLSTALSISYGWISPAWNKIQALQYPAFLHLMSVYVSLRFSYLVCIGLVFNQDRHKKYIHIPSPVQWLLDRSVRKSLCCLKHHLLMDATWCVDSSALSTLDVSLSTFIMAESSFNRHIKAHTF